MSLHRFNLIALLAVAAGMSCTQILGFDKDFEEVETGSTSAGAAGTGTAGAGTSVGGAGTGVGGAGTSVGGAGTGVGGAGTGVGGAGGTGTGGTGGGCTEGAIEVCSYSGPPGTENVGQCKAGTMTCTAGMWTACTGEVLPAAETCNTPYDDDCNGQVNESGTGCSCAPGSMIDCYSGPMGTEGVGICHKGTQTCNPTGTGYEPCQGEVPPGIETCNTPEDDNCNGQVNESGTGCVCLPNSTASCYTGPMGTQGVGICMAGTWTCNAMGTAWGPCQGQVLPGTEMCNTPEDDDCDGLVNEEGTTCGLRLYTRPFPPAGSYTSVLLKDTWVGPNAPPSTGILATELNVTAVRLMVWANNGMYYERYNNVWQPPVMASARFVNLPSGNIVASALLGRFYLPSTDEMLILTTNDNPPVSYTYRVPLSGMATYYESGPDNIAPNPDPNAPAQDVFPLDWATGEFRKPTPQDGEDWTVGWKGLGGTTYEQWIGNFTFNYKPKQSDATGPFLMNGIVPAPAPGSAVAAYYDAVLDTVSFIAP